MDLKPLKKEDEFTFVFKNKIESININSYRAMLTWNDSGNINYGFILPRKYLKLAVNRNYIRRLVKQTLRELDTAKGFNFIFMIRSKIASFEKEEVKKNIEELKRKLELALR
ncbi:ribonuclease P protein component [SAR86 cluster bacterium]|nr:ribonuclease P protein component [SAR86 cluster bacterium]